MYKKEIVTQYVCMKMLRELFHYFIINMILDNNIISVRFSFEMP